MMERKERSVIFVQPQAAGGASATVLLMESILIDVDNDDGAPQRPEVVEPIPNSECIISTEIG
jgi:hypothetical protein